MASLPAKSHRLAVFISAITPENAHEDEDKGAAEENEKLTATARIVQIQFRISRYLRARKSSAPAPLSEHAYENDEQAENEEGGEKQVSEDAKVRIVRRSCNLKEKQQDDA